jgi:hypothetical protein
MPQDSFGTTFSWNGQVVANLNKINGIELSVDSVDTTTHQSANAYKDSDPGLVNAGEVSIEGFFEVTDTNGQQAMLTDASARTTRTGIITFPSGIASWTFTGYITKIKIGDAPVDGKIPFSASIKPKGKPTFAIATSVGMSALAISGSAVITPVFAIGTFEYIATVLTGVSSVTVTPTAANHTITVTANGASQTVISGQASSAIALGAAGTNTTITITVQEANKAPKTYTVRVARAAA